MQGATGNIYYKALFLSFGFYRRPQTINIVREKQYITK